MQVERIVQIALLLLGIVLLVMGIRETDSFGSQVSEFFTGKFSDRAVWMMIGGVALIVFGGAFPRVFSKKAGV